VPNYTEGHSRSVAHAAATPRVAESVERERERERERGSARARESEREREAESRYTLHTAAERKRDTLKGFMFLPDCGPDCPIYATFARQRSRSKGCLCSLHASVCLYSPRVFWNSSRGESSLYSPRGFPRGPTWKWCPPRRRVGQRKRNELSVLSLKPWTPGPDSGPDCLTCATFARQRSPHVSGSAHLEVYG